MNGGGFSPEQRGAVKMAGLDVEDPHVQMACGAISKLPEDQQALIALRLAEMLRRPGS